MVVVAVVVVVVMAEWAVHRGQNCENPDSNSNPTRCRVEPWANCPTLHCPSSLSCINEYLTIDSGGYVNE